MPNVRSLLVLSLFLTCSVTPGCAPTSAEAADVEIDVDFRVDNADPEYDPSRGPVLVYVSPGVYAVAQQPHGVFLAEGAYWTVRDGAWFRARRAGSSWVAVRHSRVPERLRVLHPARYRFINPWTAAYVVYDVEVRDVYDGRGAAPPGHLRHRWGRTAHKGGGHSASKDARKAHKDFYKAHEKTHKDARKAHEKAHKSHPGNGKGRGKGKKRK